MTTINRRRFIKNSSLTLAGTILGNSVFAQLKTDFRLSFSTLGCPKWPLSKIVSFANENGFSGVEIRGIEGEFDLSKCPDFGTANRIVESKKMFIDKRLVISCLSSSAELHHADKETRIKNLDVAKKFIDLAQKLDCSYIRVMPNKFQPNQEFNAATDLITQGLHELSAYTKGSNVSILLESHGDIVSSDILLDIMKNSESPNVGMVWDICNMWSATKERPSLVYEKLKKYIRHIHLRDVKFQNGEYKTALLGKGEAPILDAVKVLVKGNYKGFYNLEWEKYWEPDLEEPEIAFPQFSREIRKYLNG